MITNSEKELRFNKIEEWIKKQRWFTYVMDGDKLKFYSYDSIITSNATQSFLRELFFLVWGDFDIIKEES